MIATDVLRQEPVRAKLIALSAWDGLRTLSPLPVIVRLANRRFLGARVCENVRSAALAWKKNPVSDRITVEPVREPKT